MKGNSGRRKRNASAAISSHQESSYAASVTAANKKFTFTCILYIVARIKSDENLMAKVKPSNSRMIY
jgi:hypothetical protein